MRVEVELLRPRVQQRQAEDKAKDWDRLVGLLDLARAETERKEAARAVAEHEEYMRLDPRERHVREQAAARQREAAQWK